MSEEQPQAGRNGTAKLAAALAKAQAAFTQIAKNRTVQIRMREGGAYTFRYADLEAIISATRPALASNGLAVLQVIVGEELQTILAHESGESVVSTMKLPPMHPADPKSYGAGISYLRRYAYQSMVCVASDDDLDQDGTEAGAPQQQVQQQAQSAPQKPAYSDDQFDKNFPLWEGMVKQGKKTPADIIKTVESKAVLSDDQKKKINGLKAEEQQQ